MAISTTRKFLPFIGVLTLMSGCAIHHGTKIDVANANRVMVGITKKTEIVEMFGKPQSRQSGEGFEMWGYVDAVEKGDPILFGTTGQDTTQLTLTFTGDVIASCQITVSTSSVWSASTLDSYACGKGGQ